MNQNKDVFDTLEDLGDTIGDIGEGLQDMIGKAVSSQDFKDLSKRVNEQIRNFQQSDMAKAPFSRNASARTGQNAKSLHASDRVQNSPIRTDDSIKEDLSALYAKTTSAEAGDYLFTAGGVLLLLLALSGFMGAGLFGLLFGSTSILGLGVTAIAALIGAVLTWKGVKGLHLIFTFKKIIKALGSNRYITFADLASALRRPVKDIKKDVKNMLEQGWFLQGHIDKQETCLMTSEETYKQYMQTQHQYEERQAEEKAEADKKQRYSAELREVLEKGAEYVATIRKCNEEIPGEEISAKITKMEQIVAQIFKQAEAHPEVVSDLKRMMNYYLPTAIKLLNAYREMDAQVVQGENIINSKKEIEATLDTLNEAFAKLLDSVFHDTAWDVSTDISVLNTVLAQEGLKASDF